MGIIGTFDTQIEAETYIGLENTQFESEGVKYSIYKRVERPESHLDDKNRISMANNKKEEMTAEKLSDKITIENVTKQIEENIEQFRNFIDQIYVLLKDVHKISANEYAPTEIYVTAKEIDKFNSLHPITETFLIQLNNILQT